MHIRICICICIRVYMYYIRYTTQYINEGIKMNLIKYEIIIYMINYIFTLYNTLYI